MRIWRTPAASVSTSIPAPKPASIFSVWSRVITGSITVVTPGVFRAASSTADLTCAEGIGTRYSMGAARFGPQSVSGMRSPGAASSTCTPISLNGSSTRPIGRFDSEASPMKVVLMS